MTQFIFYTFVEESNKMLFLENPNKILTELWDFCWSGKLFFLNFTSQNLSKTKEGQLCSFVRWRLFVNPLVSYAYHN